MPRGKYAKISEETRKALILKDEDGGDFIKLAADLGIKRTTAISIVKSGKAVTEKRGGKRERLVKLSEEDLNKIVDIIGQNPFLTLKQLCGSVNNCVTPSMYLVQTS